LFFGRFAVPKLRELREASGLTQLELAKRAHIDRTRLSLSESGYVQLSAGEEERLRTVVLEAAREQVVKLQGVIAATI
jgi:transcriptional regulator with XRE-family HTH domain